MARQHQLEPPQRPFFQCLGQEGVVGVGKRAPRDVPGLVPSKAGFVEQDPHQLRNGQAGMGIVELNRDFDRQRTPIGIVPTEAPHEIRQGAGDQEILLHEAQTSPQGRRIVGIENPSDRVGCESLGQGGYERTSAERLEVKDIGCGGRP